MKQCKIVINNEVTCNILGLEAKDRRALFKRFEYEVPGAKYLPSVKLGRWDGKISYFSLGGSTYINLLPEILDYLYDQHYDIELDDTRSYNRNFNLTPIVEDTFSNTVWPDKHPMAGQPIVLRDYQVNIVNKFLSNLQSIQEIATGAGKTLVVSALSKKVEPYGRSIVIVPNKSLVTQTEADYRNLGLDVGVYFGERKELGHKHTICTWQSLNIIVKNTKDNVGDINIQDFLHDVVALIVDEVHMAKADVLRTMLSTHASKIPIRWGLTGTVPKEKYASTSLFSCIGPLINTLSANDLQNRGVLAQCHVNIVQLQDNTEFGNYQSELKYLLENRERLNLMANLVIKIKESGNTLVLVDRVTAGKELVSRLPNAVFISGTTKLNERKEEYEEVAVSSDKIIVATYGVAAVGINIPRIFNLVLVEPGKSFVRVIQSIGRGIRKAEDKDYVQIWDITSSCKFAKRHLTERKKFYNDAKYPYVIEKLQYK